MAEHVLQVCHRWTTNIYLKSCRSYLEEPKVWAVYYFKLYVIRAVATSPGSKCALYCWINKWRQLTALEQRSHRKQFSFGNIEAKESTALRRSIVNYHTGCTVLFVFTCASDRHTMTVKNDHPNTAGCSFEKRLRSALRRKSKRLILFTSSSSLFNLLMTRHYVVFASLLARSVFAPVPGFFARRVYSSIITASAETF